MLKMKTLRNIIILAQFVLLAACTKQWFLEIERWDAAMGPVFCLNEGGECGKRGVQLHFISVTEAGSKGAIGRTVWQIQNVTDKDGQATLTTLAYGEVPAGWAEVTKAQRLLSDTYYSINEEYYFIRDASYRYSVLSRDEYFSRRQAESSQK